MNARFSCERLMSCTAEVLATTTASTTRSDARAVRSLLGKASKSTAAKHSARQALRRRANEGRRPSFISEGPGHLRRPNPERAQPKAGASSTTEVREGDFGLQHHRRRGPDIQAKLRTQDRRHERVVRREDVLHHRVRHGLNPRRAIAHEPVRAPAPVVGLEALWWGHHLLTRAPAYRVF